MLPSPGATVDQNQFTLTMLERYGSADRVPPQCTSTQLVCFPWHGYRGELRQSLGLLGNQRVADVVWKRKKIAGEVVPWGVGMGG